MKNIIKKYLANRQALTPTKEAIDLMWASYARCTADPTAIIALAYNNPLANQASFSHTC